MMNAYDQNYLECAQDALGGMLDYAVHAMGLELRTFYDLFLAGEIAGRFAVGEPRVIAGRSGPELAMDVWQQAYGEYVEPVAYYAFDRTPDYWTGWALAYYQWERAESFRAIDRDVPVEEIVDMYVPLHEADINKFVYSIDEMRMARTRQTRLARLRSYAKLSQRMLAERSGVSIRTIQQYEQRQKRIDRAQSRQLSHLATALGCRIEELMEPELPAQR